MEISDVAVLLTHASTATRTAQESLPHTQPRQAAEGDASQSCQQKQAPDSLIQVIEKLSKIVEKRPQRRCTLAGHKRTLQQTFTAGEGGGGGGGEEGARRSRGGSPYKKVKQEAVEEITSHLSPCVSGDDNNNNIPSTVTEADSGDHKRTVTCYQCSLCPYLSQTLPLLKEHLKQHNEQHNDLILMCSECHFSSRDQGQLEAHVRLHFKEKGNSTSPEEKDVLLKSQGDWPESSGSVGPKVTQSSLDNSKELSQKKKWYSHEEYGLYRCLICSYVCSQQRMLKTHAWKHAGLVDCSYPIFEDEDEAPVRKEPQAAANSVTAREDIVVLSPVPQDKSLQTLPNTFKLQLCVPLAADSNCDMSNHPVSSLNQSPKTQDLTSEEPVVEVQVMTEAETEVEVDSHHDSTSVTDSLLSSAQKIINSSPNSAGHINVIVERLPSAEDTVMATNPLLLSPDVDRDKSLLDAEEEEQDCVGCVKTEVVLGSSEVDTADSQLLGSHSKSSVALNSSSPRDENIPPAGRKRTHSESLRLHSLAAEALVAMPMRTPELPLSSSKGNLKLVTAQAQSLNTDQKLVGVSTCDQKASDVGTTPVTLKHHNSDREEEFGSLGLGEGDEECPAAKAGISLSLLTVIEKLRERSDQNATDEDILKELQDNAQFQNGAVAGVVTGSGAENCVIPDDGGLVDYIPDSERPYRCRLCRYSSGNKGYIKQHLRVHRQREPYQCPICEHIASDSKDLESHMIHHCKTRMYQCKQCHVAFHYKVSWVPVQYSVSV